uniref:Uncharacterized protein n=1 Tax=Arundo donax TaxID=35708 RepID=A0A0A9CM11_ARUDO
MHLQKERSNILLQNVQTTYLYVVRTRLAIPIVVPILLGPSTNASSLLYLCYGPEASAVQTRSDVPFTVHH